MHVHKPLSSEHKGGEVVICQCYLDFCGLIMFTYLAIR